MADKLFIGTDGDYDSAANWSPANVPVAGDDVRIAAGAGSITTGLDQSAVAIGDFVVDDGYKGTIGVAPVSGGSPTYLQIDPNYFQFAGTGLSWIDVGSAPGVAMIIIKTASTAEPDVGLHLDGGAIASITVRSGSVGLGFDHGSAVTMTGTMKLMSSSARVIIGEGVGGPPSILIRNGKCTSAAPITTLNIYGGQCIMEEQATITTANIYGGILEHNSNGAITTLNLEGGSVDFTKSGLTQSITTLNPNSGELFWNPADVTFTTRNEPDTIVRETITITGT